MPTDEEYWESLTEEEKNKAIDAFLNKENWNDFLKYKIGERVGKPVVNETIQNILSVYRNINQEEAERIAKNPEYQVPNDKVSRALAWGTDAAINAAILGKASAVAKGLGLAKGIASSPKIVQSAAEHISKNPNFYKGVSDILLTDRLKEGRVSNQGQEYNTHFSDGMANAGGAIIDVAPEKINRIGYTPMKVLGKAFSKATPFIQKPGQKGLQFTIADGEYITDEDWYNAYLGTPKKEAEAMLNYYIGLLEQSEKSKKENKNNNIAQQLSQK